MSASKAHTSGALPARICEIPEKDHPDALHEPDMIAVSPVGQVM
ncbi:hypothetical protein [uncultured Sulfitobacter sp.]|nr:hypothetical protein [uncultured Sulfitobacter sp.]